MGSCLSSFVKNETDLNKNGIGDRDEMIKMVNEYVMKKLDEKEKKKIEKLSKTQTKSIKNLLK
jgi:peptidyl-tRNA hydrolase|tara:strand:- start:62 stop:250 length:189 start_codon:yes stop_codon:yes gene_type:complete